LTSHIKILLNLQGILGSNSGNWNPAYIFY